MEICFERIIKQHRSHFSAVVTFADGNEDGFRAYRSSPDYHKLRNASTQCNGLHLPIKVLQKKKSHYPSPYEGIHDLKINSSIFL